jgi:restriction endonuclease S subunit
VNAQLVDVAEIRTGYSFRGRLEPHPTGTIAVIQMKDIDRSNLLRTETLARILAPKDFEKHLVRKGDLLFRCRGQSYSAALVEHALHHAIVASPMMLIRPHGQLVEPAYLRWFLNQVSTHNALASVAAGTAVKIINKTALEKLDIPIPPIEKQRRIAALGELAQQEAKLTTELAERRQQLMEKTLLQEARREKLTT